MTRLTIDDYHPDLGYVPRSELRRLNEKLDEMRETVRFAEQAVRTLAPASPAPAKESATQDEIGEWIGPEHDKLAEQPSAALAGTLEEIAQYIDEYPGWVLALKQAAASLRSVEPAPRGEQDEAASILEQLQRNSVDLNSGNIIIEWGAFERVNTYLRARIAREGKAT